MGQHHHGLGAIGGQQATGTARGIPTQVRRCTFPNGANFQGPLWEGCLHKTSLHTTWRAREQRCHRSSSVYKALQHVDSGVQILRPCPYPHMGYRVDRVMRRLPELHSRLPRCSPRHDRIQPPGCYMSAVVFSYSVQLQPAQAPQVPLECGQ